MSNKIIKYGLTETDLKLCQIKMDDQKKFLLENHLITSNGQFKQLLDFSFSANHSVRYYAQLANKINTMEIMSISDKTIPNFLTMTLDGFFRDLLRCDYSRYNAFNDDLKQKILKSVPNNEKLGFIRNKIEHGFILTIKDLYNVLNHQFGQFRKGYAFKKLKKDGYRYQYVKTVEPHKDGVPHFHVMLFIPENYIDLFKRDYKKCFIAPQNLKSVKIGKRKYIKDSLVGFQTEINDASAYIMKYITKSFLDVKNNKNLDYLNGWFVKHRIMRCVTSRSVLPQWIYHKIAIYEKDWLYLTDILDSPNNHAEWNQEQDYFYLEDTWSQRELIYEYGQITVYNQGRLVFKSGKVNTSLPKTVVYDKIPKFWKKTNLSPTPAYHNDILIGYFRKNRFIKYKENISPDLMNDIELYNYFHKLDIETCNIQHYGYVKNNMIDRNLLDSSKLSLDFYREVVSFDVTK